MSLQELLTMPNFRNISNVTKEWGKYITCTKLECDMAVKVLFGKSFKSIWKYSLDKMGERGANLNQNVWYYSGLLKNKL